MKKLFIITLTALFSTLIHANFTDDQEAEFLANYEKPPTVAIEAIETLKSHPGLNEILFNSLRPLIGVPKPEEAQSYASWNDTEIRDGFTMSLHDEGQLISESAKDPRSIYNLSEEDKEAFQKKLKNAEDLISSLNLSVIPNSTYFLVTSDSLEYVIAIPKYSWPSPLQGITDVIFGEQLNNLIISHEPPLTHLKQVRRWVFPVTEDRSLNDSNYVVVREKVPSHGFEQDLEDTRTTLNGDALNEARVAVNSVGIWNIYSENEQRLNLRSVEGQLAFDSMEQPGIPAFSGVRNHDLPDKCFGHVGQDARCGRDELNQLVASLVDDTQDLDNESQPTPQ